MQIRWPRVRSGGTLSPSLPAGYGPWIAVSVAVLVLSLVMLAADVVAVFVYFGEKSSPLWVTILGVLAALGIAAGFAGFLLLMLLAGVPGVAGGAAGAGDSSYADVRWFLTLTMAENGCSTPGRTWFCVWLSWARDNVFRGAFLDSKGVAGYFIFCPAHEGCF